MELPTLTVPAILTLFWNVDIPTALNRVADVAPSVENPDTTKVDVLTFAVLPAEMPVSPEPSPLKEVAVTTPDIFASPLTSRREVGDALLTPKLPEPLNTALTAEIGRAHV